MDDTIEKFISIFVFKIDALLSAFETSKLLQFICSLIIPEVSNTQRDIMLLSRSASILCLLCLNCVASFPSRAGVHENDGGSAVTETVSSNGHVAEASTAEVRTSKANLELFTHSFYAELELANMLNDVVRKEYMTKDISKEEIEHNHVDEQAGLTGSVDDGTQATNRHPLEGDSDSPGPNDKAENDLTTSRLANDSISEVPPESTVSAKNQQHQTSTEQSQPSHIRRSIVDMRQKDFQAMTPGTEVIILALSDDESHSSPSEEGPLGWINPSSTEVKFPLTPTDPITVSSADDATTEKTDGATEDAEGRALHVPSSTPGDPLSVGQTDVVTSIHRAFTPDDSDLDDEKKGKTKDNMVFTNMLYESKQLNEIEKQGIIDHLLKSFNHNIDIMEIFGKGKESTTEKGRRKFDLKELKGLYDKGKEKVTEIFGGGQDAEGSTNGGTTEEKSDATTENGEKDKASTEDGEKDKASTEEDKPEKPSIERVGSDITSPENGNTDLASTEDGKPDKTSTEEDKPELPSIGRVGSDITSPENGNTDLASTEEGKPDKTTPNQDVTSPENGNTLTEEMKTDQMLAKKKFRANLKRSGGECIHADANFIQVLMLPAVFLFFMFML